MGAVDPGRAGPQDLAATHHIHPGASLPHQVQHGQVIIGLHRVVNADRTSGERPVQRMQPRPDRVGRDNPGGSADLIGDGVQGHTIQKQPVHGVHA